MTARVGTLMAGEAKFSGKVMSKHLWRKMAGKLQISRQFEVTMESIYRRVNRGDVGGLVGRGWRGLRGRGGAYTNYSSCGVQWNDQNIEKQVTKYLRDVAGRGIACIK